MTIVRLVRHGRASAGWDTDVDPGLDDLGREQAVAVAEQLLAVGAGPGGVVVVSSPLRRCRETAEVFAERARTGIVTVDAVTEIPSPEGYEISRRVEWLREAMSGSWSSLDDRYQLYRQRVIDFVSTLGEDTVVFSHFVAINAVIGACLDDDRLVIRSLDNCSITTVEVIDGTLHLIEAGTEADTLIR